MGEPSQRGSVGIVLAAGMGTRVGADGNKAYLPLAGQPMVSWALGSLARVQDIARLVLVIRADERKLAEESLDRNLPGATVELVEGGATRHASEFKALQYLASDIESGAIDVALIHDGARPLAGPEMMRTALSVAREFGGAVPALEAPDVVKVSPTGDISPMSKYTLVRVQTPQAFRALPLLQAYRAADRERFQGTDTSSCVERFTDVEVRTFQGDKRNLKVTYADDLLLAEQLLALSGGLPDGTR
jgi:2-C-methyl-D-erythritol 4-phosphate cytidylyltransferase